MSVTDDEVRLYERLTLDTAPTLNEEQLAGWRLRASGTDTRRSNSATFLGDRVDGTADLPSDKLIDDIEHWFDLHGQPAVFRLNDRLPAPEFETALSARGYQHAIDCLFMTRPVAEAGSRPPPHGASLDVVPLEVGLARLHQLKGMNAAKAAIEIERQHRWIGRQRFMLLKVDGEVAATGLGRIESGYLGIFNMQTASAFRGRGYATTLLDAICRWGGSEGVTTAFLQVERENTTALSVYEKAGFVPAYSYWHRLK